MMNLTVANSLATQQLQLFRQMTEGVAFIYTWGVYKNKGYQIVSHEGEYLVDFVPRVEVDTLIARVRREFKLEPSKIPMDPCQQPGLTYGW